jgi:PilZ domain
MIRRIVQESPEKPVPPPQAGDAPQTFERRGYVRYPRRLESFWQFLGVKSPDLASAHVFDLSMTGLRLVAAADFAANAILLIRLPTSTQGWNTHLVRVKYCKRLDDGRFQIGCAFVKPLSVAQMQALLT